MDSSDDAIAANVPKLKVNYNYNVWEDRMRSLLLREQLFGFVIGKVPPPPTLIYKAGKNGENNTLAINKEFTRWKKIDSQLKKSILSSVEEDAIQDSQFLHASDVWERLRRMHSKPKEQEEQEEQGDSGNADFFRDTMLLTKAVKRGGMTEANKIIQRYSDYEKESLKFLSLYVAVRTGDSLLSFVEQLEEGQNPYFTSEEIVYERYGGHTLLTLAASVGNTAAAEILVQQAPDLVTHTNEFNEYPVHAAAIYSQRETLEFLLRATGKWPDPYTGTHGVNLLLAVIDAGYFDLAVKLVKEYPKLATEYNDDGTTALQLMGLKKSAFERASSFKILEPICFLIPKLSNKHHMNQCALQLVDLLCSKMDLKLTSGVLTTWSNILFAAIKVGNYEIVKRIVEMCPDLLSADSPDGKKQNMFHLAARYRSREIFNLVSWFGDFKIVVLRTPDSEGNNVLHFAGKRAPADILDQIPGAALQMQYEIKWYKELESIVPHYCRTRINDEGDIPMAVFRKEHRKLKEDAEKWMRDTAQSCSIAAALIATVMFAASISVPGSNKTDFEFKRNELGFPVFSKEPVFAIFAVADAISLFASTTSVLAFLSILTCRYKEEDFYWSLPFRLIIGLFTLLLSISFLMIAFAATIYLVLGQKKKWVIAPVVIMSAVPIVTFMSLHFRVLRDWIWTSCNLISIPRRLYLFLSPYCGWFSPARRRRRRIRGISNDSTPSPFPLCNYF